MVAIKGLSDTDAFPALTGANSASGDLVLVWDASAGAYKSMTLAQLKIALFIQQSDIVIDSGTSRTLSADDNGKVIFFTSGSAIALGVPSGLPVGFACGIVQAGTGQITVAIVALSGVTLDALSGAVKTAGKGAQAGLTIWDTDKALLSGALV